MANEPFYNKFKLARGSAPILRFTVSNTDASDPASGWTTKYTIREAQDSASYALQVSGSWNSTTSTIDVTLTRTQTLTLAKGAYVGSLFRTTSNSEELVARDEIAVINSIYDAP